MTNTDKIDISRLIAAESERTERERERLRLATEERAREERERRECYALAVRQTI